MKKTVLQIVIILSLVILINLGLTTISNAALSISTSKSSVSPGEKFSVTVSVSSNEAGHIKLSANNGTLSQTNIDLMSSSSATVTCTAGNSGTITINASGMVANYDTETEANQTASPKTVTIVQPKPVTPSEPSTPSTPSTPATPTKSSNANLSNLGINPYDFRGFKAANTSYSVSVPNNVSTISIYATAQHSAAKISGTGSKSLKVGKNTFNVVVTAEDGTKKTYTLYITRQSEQAVEKPTEQEQKKSSEATLSALSIEEGTITPEFDVNVREYALNISEKISEIHVKAIPTNEKATVKIEGETELQLGENVVIIKVTAEDGTENSYTIKINIQNTKISLKSLIVGYLNGSNTLVELPISPEFNEDLFEYTIDGIDHSINDLQINAVPFSADLDVEIEGNKNLQDGRNEITIHVKRILETGEIQKVEYIIIANRKLEQKVGIVGKIKNTFTGFFKSIQNYITENRELIIVCALGFSAGAMFILSIYIIMDYRRYKMMVEKIKTLVKDNSRAENSNSQDTKIEENASK